MSKDDEQELKKVVTKGHWNLAKDKAAIQVTDSGSAVCPLSARHASHRPASACAPTRASMAWGARKGEHGHAGR